ncbi:hypothetical protein OY671_010708, partial [Metschnikowia pulcherrima]
MGWKSARIDCPAVQHYGHVMGGYRSLSRRIASGYSGAPGEVLRGASGQRHLPVVSRDSAHVRNGIAVMIWWVLLIAALFAPGSWWTSVALSIVPSAFSSLRHRSSRSGLYSSVAWNVTAFSSVPGFVRRRVPPDRPLEFVTLATG